MIFLDIMWFQKKKLKRSSKLIEITYLVVDIKHSTLNANGKTKKRDSIPAYKTNLYLYSPWWNPRYF